jgi:hypothetical protein
MELYQDLPNAVSIIACNRQWLQVKKLSQLVSFYVKKAEHCSGFRAGSDSHERLFRIQI